MTPTRFRVLVGIAGVALIAGFSRPPRKRQRACHGGTAWTVRKAIDVPVVADNLAEPMVETFNGFVLGAVGAPIHTDQGPFGIFEE